MQNEAAIHHATDSTFDHEVIRSDRPVMVDFWAPWCAPCLAMGKTLEEVGPKVAGRVKIVKINVDESPQTAAQFGIRSIPSLVFFNEGEAAGMITGALPAQSLQKALELHAEGRLGDR